MPKPPPAGHPFWKLFEGFTRLNVLAFRATRGRLGGSMQKAPVLLLHHRGRKSGKERVSPLIYAEDGPDLLVVASKGGVDKHPAWFHNVCAMDATEVELPGGERRRVRPVVADAAERERLWPKVIEVYKPYAEYQTYTSREIPVVKLQRA
jgi:F420H(2)-dependent quinone reductase